MKIQKIHARQVLDSRGTPTIAVDVTTELGTTNAMVPSGASTGSAEALELRDGGAEYGGSSVCKAVENVNKTIAERIVGMSCVEQRAIDQTMIDLDGTENKTTLGANAILGVSLAVARAGALASGAPLYAYLNGLAGKRKILLPCPMMNVMNGGKHAGRENDVQEIMIMPVGCNSFSEALRACVETYQLLKKKLKKTFGAQATLVGDEGGFVPPIASFEGKLEFLLAAVRDAGYEKEFAVALDPASTDYYNKEKNQYQIGRRVFSPGEMVDFWAEQTAKYPIISLEDGMAEEDWPGWTALTKKLGNKIQLVGDDNLVTNPKRIQHAMNVGACNALLLKVNQIGSLSESLDAAELSVKNKWGVVVSHRSGETEDSFIADLAVALGCGQIKTGAPARSDRVAKYNRLLKIEEDLGGAAVFAPPLRK